VKTRGRFNREKSTVNQSKHPAKEEGIGEVDQRGRGYKSSCQLVRKKRKEREEETLKEGVGTGGRKKQAKAQTSWISRLPGWKFRMGKSPSGGKSKDSTKGKSRHLEQIKLPRLGVWKKGFLKCQRLSDHKGSSKEKEEDDKEEKQL